MAWTYTCADEGLTIEADDRDELADKIIEHLNTVHNTHVSHEQAMDIVDRIGRQRAA